MSQQLPFSFYGFDIIDGNETGNWVAIQAHDGDATLSTTTFRGNSEASFTLPDGAITYGPYTGINVTAGKVKAYKNVTEHKAIRT